jgi:hypothetical protein
MPEERRRRRSRRKKTLREEWSQLTLGERLVTGQWMLLTLVLPTAGGVVTVLGSGATRTIGIALLLVGLIMCAIPISPFLKARIRRRQRASADS